MNQRYLHVFFDIKPINALIMKKLQERKGIFFLFPSIKDVDLHPNPTNDFAAGNP